MTSDQTAEILRMLIALATLLATLIGKTGAKAHLKRRKRRHPGLTVSKI